MIPPITNIEDYVENGKLTIHGARILNAIRTALTGDQGWDAATGTATRTTFDTATVTTEELAEAVKALSDDLTAAGILG